jgi:hypothetical protein
MSTYYILDDSNKKDVKFLKSLYDFCNKNYLIQRENKYVVLAHSVMEITQAIVNITNYKLKYNNGKYRTYITTKENNLNLNSSDTKNIILVNTPAHLPRDENANINFSEFDNVIKCCDNTWSLIMYENNKERKDRLEDADIYMLSGKYLCGNPHDSKTLPINNLKVSMGFFKDKALAKSIQNQINHLTSGFKYCDILEIKKIISKPLSLMSVHKKNYNLLRSGVNSVKMAIKKYNKKYPEFKVNYEVEPSMYFVYVTSSSSDINIKNFTIFYKKLNFEAKLYENSKQLRNVRQTIFIPDVANGVMIISYD